MKKTALRHGFLLASLSLASSAYASNFQSFSGICYSNPAELPFLVNSLQMILGDTLAVPDVTFNGEVIVPAPAPVTHLLPPVVSAGSSTNVNSFTMPYGRIAKRIVGGLVADVDVTEPFKKAITYADDSAVRYAATKSQVDSIDIAPNLAYQFSGPLEKFSVGAGLDALKLSVALGQQFPSLPERLPRPPFIVPFGAGPDLSVSEVTSSWAYGWHLGAVFHAFEGTFFGVSYFSSIDEKTTGTSTFTGFPQSNDLIAAVNLPATTNFDLTQFFTKAWLVRLDVHYTQWSSIKQIVLQNTAGPPQEVIPTNYRNTWRVDLSSRYDVTPKTTIGGLVAVDQTPTNNIDRTVRLPEGEDLILGLLLDYKLTPQFTVEGNGGHLFTLTQVPINNTSPAGITSIGTSYVSGNFVGVKLMYNI